MPLVGTKHFPYTTSGIRSAKLWAAKTGQRMTMKKNPKSKTRRPTKRRPNNPNRRSY